VTTSIFQHIGRICKIIRRYQEGLTGQPNPKQMAEACGVGVRMIQAFEGEDKMLGSDPFDEFDPFAKYLQRLRMPREAKTRLGKMYYSQKYKQILEAKLGYYHFELIADSNKNRYPALARLVRELQDDPRPACIVDTLFFIHAVNQPFLRLIGLDLKRHLLKNPLLWHLVTAEYYGQSPIRQAYQDPENQDASSTVQAFFEAVYPYFFTPTVTALRLLLFHLAPQEFWYEEWVPRVTMQRPWRREHRPLRPTIYERKLTRWNLVEPKIPTQVDIVNGPTLKYHLLYWEPVGQEAEAVQGKLAATVAGRTVVFAADPEFNIPYDIQQWFRYLPR
jgi:hypothetical protein